MSASYAQLLMRRAKDYLASAETNFEKGRYDVAAVEFEIAAQLALKALITKAGLEPPRPHRIRQLLALIARACPLPDEARRELEEFSKHRRAELIILERAREAGQYGGHPVDAQEAEIARKIAREVVAPAERYWSLVA